MTWQDIDAEQQKTANFTFDYGPLLKEIISKLPTDPLVVELGTYLGCSVAYMADKIGNGRLYSVDIFDKYACSTNFYMKAMSNIKACGFRDKAHILSCRSWEAAQLFDDKEVDFVWVDAGHDFLSVKSDLESWAPKVKPGGFLAGHDYSEPGVAQAVEKFCFSPKREFHVWNETGWKSWWIQM
jgi:predicted O-methyltransferase YrrM